VIEIDLYGCVAPFRSTDPYCVRDFLKSFSTLHKFTMKVPAGWSLVLVIRSLHHHNELESYNLMFEERDMKTLYIGHVRRTNSMLKEFGHCFRNITNTLGCKDVPPEVVKEIREVASRVVKFTQLEHWQLICSMPVSRVQRHAAETLAKLMHKSCCQAAGSVDTCRIRKVSISTMAKDMRAETVRETFEFIFPSTTT
jgi:hypothetical protein